MDSNFCSSIFSGILGSLIGAFISAFVVWKQIGKTTQSLQMQNQLELRKMFSEDKRWGIHLVLQELKNLAKDDIDDKYLAAIAARCELIDKLPKKNDSDAKKLSKEELKKKLEDYLKIHKRELDDYLGLFEVAYKMLKDRLLDKEIFFQSYSYRLSNLRLVDYVNKEILCTDSGYWKILKQLLTENDKWVCKNKYCWDE